MGSNAFMTRYLKNKSDAHFEIPFLSSRKPCSHQNRLKRKKKLPRAFSAFKCFVLKQKDLVCANISSLDC